MILRKIAALAIGSALLSSSALAVTLLHTNDVLGEIEPCGCRSNPQGGMARLYNLAKRLNDETLLLDAGDLLFATTQVPELLQKQTEVQAGYLLKTMDAIGWDASVPGEKDFAMGLKIFEKLRKGSQVHFLAANLMKRKGGRLLEASRVFTKKGPDGKPLRIAVIGLVGNDLDWPHELKATPAIAAARKEVAALRKKADLVIALTHEGLEEDKALAKAVPGIDIIVGGHSQSFLQEPTRIGGTVLYQSSFRNQYVGVVPLSKPFKSDAYKLVGLDVGYESPADAPSRVDALVKEFKGAVAELNSKEEQQMLQESHPEALGDASRAETKFQTFPRCAECHLKQFDFWRKTPHAQALAPLIEKEQFKNKECLTCHTVGLGDPKGFSTVAHLAEVKVMTRPSPTPDGSNASEEGKTVQLETEELARFLKAMGSAKSLKDEVKITQADTVGQPLPRQLNRLVRSWTPVQCENCHMPGQDHPFSGTYSKKVEKTVCLNCHTAERAPEWYTKSGQPDWDKIAAKRALITCPAGELSESDL